LTSCNFESSFLTFELAKAISFAYIYKYIYGGFFLYIIICLVFGALSQSKWTASKYICISKVKQLIRHQLFYASINHASKSILSTIYINSKVLGGYIIIK